MHCEDLSPESHRHRGLISYSTTSHEVLSLLDRLRNDVPRPTISHANIAAGNTRSCNTVLSTALFPLGFGLVLSIDLYGLSSILRHFPINLNYQCPMNQPVGELEVTTCKPSPHTSLHCPDGWRNNLAKKQARRLQCSPIAPNQHVV